LAQVCVFTTSPKVRERKRLRNRLGRSRVSILVCLKVAVIQPESGKVSGETIAFCRIVHTPARRACDRVRHAVSAQIIAGNGNG
jgi:hypothetical protein